MNRPPVAAAARGPAPVPDAVALPPTATLVLAPGAVEVEPGVLRTSDPVRLVRLRHDVDAVRRLLAGEPVPVHHLGAGTARRLVDTGAAAPVVRDGAPAAAAEVRRRATIVVPVRDRAGELDRALPGLVAQAHVVVVDDGSVDPAAIEQVARRHGAVVVRREVNGGPGAARTSGLAAVDTEVVVLVDSDVTGPDGWIGALLPSLDDPAVAVVAPRVASRPGPGLLARYEVRHSPLDLGPRPALVHPHGRVAYLPSAAWVARREALADGFTPGMRVAEDVDAVWRLHATGWRALYRPQVVVHHTPRPDVRSALRQRASYASGATALALAHPGGAPPIRLTPWTAVTVLGLATLHPLGAAVALVATARTVLAVARTLPVQRRLQVATDLVARGLGRTVRSVARASVRALPPVTVLVAVATPRVAGLLLTGWLVDVLLERQTRPPAPAVDDRPAPPLALPVELAGRLLDDLAYAAGLWAGAWRGRSVAALLPRSGRVAARRRNPR